MVGGGVGRGVDKGGACAQERHQYFKVFDHTNIALCHIIS